MSIKIKIFLLYCFLFFFVFVVFAVLYKISSCKIMKEKEFGEFQMIVQDTHATRQTVEGIVPGQKSKPVDADMPAPDHQYGLAVWEGGAPMPLEDVAVMIQRVAPLLGFEPDRVKPLLLEICAVESDFGFIVKQTSGPALSPWQIEPRTWDYLLRRLKSERPDLHVHLNGLYRPGKSQFWNRTRNIPYACASAMLLVHLVFPNGFDGNLSTISARAKMWKRWYNTPKGLGTVSRYARKSREHVWNKTAKLEIVNYPVLKRTL